MFKANVVSDKRCSVWCYWCWIWNRW